LERKNSFSDLVISGLGVAGKIQAENNSLERLPVEGGVE